MAKQQTNTATDMANKLQDNSMRDTANTIEQNQSFQKMASDRSSQDYDTASQGYGNFAKTGGFSPSDETTFLNRATRGVAGTYDVLKSAADRRRAASGGLGTGGTDVALARHSAQDVASANTDAMASLKQQENQNKLSGLAGISHLFDTNTNTITQQGAQILQALGIRYNTQAEAAQIMQQLSKNPGLLDNIQRIGGMVAGGLTGISGLGGKGEDLSYDMT